MKPELAALEELQSLDLETLALRNEAQAIPENLKAMEADVAGVRDLLRRETERLTEAETWRRDRDREVALHNELMGKSKGKLGAARNEKEQKAAQREIDTIRKNMQEREEEALKVMEAIEQYRSAIDAHTKEFAELEAHLAASQEEGSIRLADLEARIAMTETRRSELAGRVPLPMLRLYERIHKRLGRAVVEAIDGKCTGCHMELLAQMYNELQRGDKMFQCPNCKRILVFRPKQEQPAAL